MFIEVTREADGKKVLVNPAWVAVISPKQDGALLVFHDDTKTTVVESYQKIAEMVNP